MSLYLRADNPAGLTLPWAYQRYVVARHWGCKPTEVDMEPLGEVLEALTIMGLENEAAEFRRKRGNG